jgi:uncharacterized BrkB/YihY/UPF0761 family membrane protein
MKWQLFSVALFGTVLWAVFALLPRARREHDRLAMTCAVLTALLALVALLVFAPPVR